MTTEITKAPTRETPVPPGGGSWRFDEAAWAWVSNDPAPATNPDVADAQPANTTTEQEQQ